MKYLFSPQRLALAMAILSSFTAVSAADKKIPTISVARTQASDLEQWQPAMGDGLAQMITTEMSWLTNFKVLESLALEDLREERSLGENGEVDESESVKKGQWKGADYTFKSTVTRFGSKENSYGGHGWAPSVPGGPDLGWISGELNRSENEVQIDWRIIDNTTREIVQGASGRAVGKVSGTSFNLDSWPGGGFVDNHEFMESALGKATMKAIEVIVENVKKLDIGPGARTQSIERAAEAKAVSLKKVKGTVQLVDGKEIWVSLGTANGFAKGDKVKVYKPSEKKNKKGEVVATTYEVVAEITLQKVLKDKSMGECGNGTTIEEEWTVTDSSLDVESLE